MNWTEELVEKYISPEKVIDIYNMLEEISTINVLRKGLDEVESIANLALETFCDEEIEYLYPIHDKETLNKITNEKVVTLLTAFEVIANGDPISVEPEEINDLAKSALKYFNS